MFGFNCCCSKKCTYDLNESIVLDYLQPGTPIPMDITGIWPSPVMNANEDQFTDPISADNWDGTFPMTNYLHANGVFKGNKAGSPSSPANIPSITTNQGIRSGRSYRFRTTRRTGGDMGFQTGVAIRWSFGSPTGGFTPAIRQLYFASFDKMYLVDDFWQSPNAANVIDSWPTLYPQPAPYPITTYSLDHILNWVSDSSGSWGIWNEVFVYTDGNGISHANNLGNHTMPINPNSHQCAVQFKYRPNYFTTGVPSANNRFAIEYIGAESSLSPF